MKCERCGDNCDKWNGTSELVPYWKNRKQKFILCQKCYYGLIEWIASGNYIQKKINAEEL